MMLIFRPCNQYVTWVILPHTLTTGLLISANLPSSSTENPPDILLLQRLQRL